MPESFLSVRARVGDEQFRRQLLEYLIKTYGPTIIILDGITDFVTDINDQKETKEVIDWLTKLCETFNLVVIVVIHTTKSTGAMTGAIGTAIEKKAETAIEVELVEGAEDVSSNVICKLARNKPFKTFSITYNEQSNRYEKEDEKNVTTKGKYGSKGPNDYKEEIVRHVVDDIFQIGPTKARKNFYKIIQAALKKQTGDTINNTEAFNWQNYFLTKLIMIEGPDDTFMRVVEKKPEPAAYKPPAFDFNTKERDVNDDLPF
jgi:hypothetical protein